MALTVDSILKLPRSKKIMPRWKTFPFPLQIMPRRTSTSGRLEKMRIPSGAFHRLKPDSSALHKLWIVKPIAE
jgi:hypothetical protein